MRIFTRIVSTMAIMSLSPTLLQASPYACESSFSSRDQIKKDIEDKKKQRLEDGKTPEADIFTEQVQLELERQFYTTVDSVTQYSETKELKQYDSLVKYHNEPNEAFASIVNAIENAKYSIDVSYYIFARDNIGYTILQKLREAHKRGVQIRIMVDSLGSPHPFHGELKAMLVEKGGQRMDIDGKPLFDRNNKPILATVEIKVFQPIVNIPVRLKKWMALTMKGIHALPVVVLDQVNKIFDSDLKCTMCEEKFNVWSDVYDWRDRRSHDKILGIDLQHPNDARFFTGGRNMAVPYFGIPKVDDKTFHDLSVEIRPLPNQIDHIGLDVADYYNKLYFHLANKNLSKWFFAMKLSLYEKQLKKMGTLAASTLAPDSQVGKTYAALKQNIENSVNGFDQSFKLASVRLLHDIENISRRNAIRNPLEKSNRQNAASVTQEIYSAIKLAKKSIKIVSPYLFLYPEQLKILQEWVSEDPTREVTIFGNSVYSADNMADQALTDHIVGPAIMNGFPYGEKGAAAKSFEAPEKWNTGWKNTRGQIKMLAMGAAPEDSGVLAKIGKLHEKVYIIDDKQVIAGTSNEDPRSMYLNSEVAVEINDVYQNGVHSKLLADVDWLFSRATLYGSADWEAVRNNPINKMKRVQCDFLWHIVSRWQLWGYL